MAQALVSQTVTRVQISLSYLPAVHQKVISYLMITLVPAVVLAKASVAVPKPTNSFVQISGHLVRAKSQEKCWLEHAAELFEIGYFGEW